MAWWLCCDPAGGHNTTQRIQPEETKKKKNHFPPPKFKKQNALDIDIYTYVTAQAHPPEGVPPAPRIVKMGCHGRNHGFFFLGRLGSVPVVGRSWVVGHGRAIRNRSLGRGVRGVLRISNFVRNTPYKHLSVMRGLSGSTC
jgi:hypothetical protein